MAKHFTSWGESERETLSLIVKKEQYAWYLTLVYFLLYDLWKGCGAYSLLFHLLCMPFIYCMYQAINSSKLLQHRHLVVIVYFEVIQIFHYKWATELPEESFSFLLASTVILVSNQLSPILPSLFNIGMIVQHVGFWYWFSLGQKALTNMSLFTLVNMIWAIFHLFTQLQVKQNVLKSEFSHMESLGRKEEHIAALYDALPTGVLVISEDKKVVSYNSMLLEFLHIPMQPNVEEILYAEISNLEWMSEYLTPTTAGSTSIITDIMNYIASDKTEVVSLGVMFVHGKYLEWRVNKLKCDQREGCIMCIRDITTWVELENIMKQEIDSKSALLRSVSHELRTPTNAIINLLQELREKEELTHEGEQDVSMLLSSAYFLLSMINDLLDYSSLVNGKFGLTKQFFNLETTIGECVQLIEVQCRHKKVELIMRYDPLLPAQAYNDKNRLKQVVLNLLSNALKFTMAGRIEVVVLSVSDTHAGIRVLDTGVGISESSIGKIFKMFGKLEGNEKLNPQGCGLGLSISAMLVKSMGGSEIHVKSKRRVGSLFAFEVNITRLDDALPPTDFLPESPEIWEEVEKIVIPGAISVKSELVFPDILIADDVDYNRIVLRKILDALGYDCDEAITGVQVLQMVRSRASLGRPYLVILMDVEMPEMDGITATREIFHLVERRELEVAPVIIGCSAYSSAEDREKCMRAGMQYYHEKPVNRAALGDLLTGMVPRSRYLRLATVALG